MTDLRAMALRRLASKADDPMPLYEQWQQYLADERALADFAAKVLSEMPEGDGLPEGPLEVDSQRPFFIYAGDRLVAQLNPFGHISDCEQAAIATLLIWARRVVENK